MVLNSLVAILLQQQTSPSRVETSNSCLLFSDYARCSDTPPKYAGIYISAESLTVWQCVYPYGITRFYVTHCKFYAPYQVEDRANVSSSE